MIELNSLLTAADEDEETEDTSEATHKDLGPSRILKELLEQLVRTHISVSLHRARRWLLLITWLLVVVRFPPLLLRVELWRWRLFLGARRTESLCIQ